MTDDNITHPDTNPVEEAALEERRRELLAHYHRCREQYPINRNHEVIE